MSHLVACSALVAILASGCVSEHIRSSAGGELLYARDTSARLTAKISIVSFPVNDGGREWRTAGILRTPYTATTQPRPAIVIVHGSGGVDSRGEHYAEALNRAGFVTLEIDFMGAAECPHAC